MEVFLVCFFVFFGFVESVAKVFEWKYGLVYYIFGCFGGKNGLKMAFWSRIVSFWPIVVLVVWFLMLFGV